MITRRKTFYPISDSLRNYLAHYGRLSEVPLVYDELLRFTGASPYENPKGEAALWLVVMHPPELTSERRPRLPTIVSMLQIGYDLIPAHLPAADPTDFGEFGNSRPFRIRITNLFNGNSDYYYVKHADASRLFGLELEHILSPNRINYLVNGNTLIEEHIAGVPGDVFIRDYLSDPALNHVRVAKEFVKFGERCFLRMLGDMRTVNYVVDITPDFEEVQYRVRPIDFDQQSYEGKLSVYRAHMFPDNRPVEELVRSHLNDQTILQYRAEEHLQMSRRAKVERNRLKAVLTVMNRTNLAPHEHVVELREAMVERYGSHAFEACES
ncbi:MAG: hypothetical protein H8E96_06725, partial [Verrucomicrobiaceae bacterium]|nr:hypothetical protein [Verrucomicrobiaceae bacterium]